MKHPAVIVTAAGYGGFPPIEKTNVMPPPKVLELVDRKTMLVRSIEAAYRAGLGPFVVVDNPFSSRLIRKECALRSPVSVRHETQSGQTGPADAALLAIPWLRKRGVEDALVIFSDMPLWSSATIARLAEVHVKNGAIVSMATVDRSPEYPELERYGRVIRDDEGRICRIVEPHYATGMHSSAITSEEQNAPSVNPSLFIWRLEWLERHIDRVPHVPNWKGRSNERFLPPLIKVVYGEGYRVHEVRVADRHEALGVNSEEQLDRVRSIAAAVREDRTAQTAQVASFAR